MLVQPQVSRCVVLVTTLASNDVEDVVSWLRPQLGLQHPVRDIAVRRNDHPADAVFAGSGMDPNLLECKPETLAGHQALFFAGSYVRNTYVVDSAEGASRSAYNAVGRLLASRPQLADAAGAHASWRQARGLPAAGWATRPASHPNARTQGHLQNGTWWLASWISTAVTVVASRSIHHIAELPAGRPIVFLAQGDGAFAGYSAMRIFRKLDVRVRAVLPAHIFAGFRGFLLSILGAVPMQENPHATAAALAAAIRSGESVLLPDPEGRDLAIRVAATTCVPLVPIIGTAGRRVSSPRRYWRRRVTIIVSAPVEICLDVGVAGPRMEATIAELARRAETLHSNRR